MKTKIFTLLLAVAASVGMMQAAIINGTCGENLTYSLADGVLTISGTGEMWNFTSDGSPWYKRRDINQVIITNNVTSIGDYAFADNSSLVSITIGYGVMNIGKGAFKKCIGLTSLTIHDYVINIGNFAFRDCINLNTLNIIGVTSIGSSAFEGCTGMTSLTIGSVTSIGDYAFGDCRGLKSVTIPNHVTSIGSNAFYNVLNIVYSGTATGAPWGAKSINGFLDGNLVYSDETKTALLGCSSVATEGITIPNSVTSIGDNAFRGCTGLTSIEIPNSVTSIGSDAFAGCYSLTSIAIPSSVTSIGDYAFNLINNIVYSGSATGSPWGAKSINGFVDGNLVYSDETKTALLGCSSTMTGEVNIPNSVINIGDYAFSYCDGLTSIELPNSVTDIGYDAFAGCYGISSVICHAETPPVGGSDCGLDNSNCILYVPTTAVETYTNSEWWEYFMYIFSIGTKYQVKFIDWDGTELKIDNVEYGKTATPPTNPERDDYIFAGWDKDFSSITSDLIVTATYTYNGCISLLTKVQATSYNQATVTGQFTGTPSVNLSKKEAEKSEFKGETGYKLDSQGRHLGITFDQGKTLQENDIVTVFVTTTSSKMQIFSDMGETLISETDHVVQGENIFVLDQRANGAQGVYVCRVLSGAEGGQYNSHVAYISVERHCLSNDSYSITFQDWNGTILSAQDVISGEAAVAPTDPTRTGYTFTGWDKDFSNVTEDMVVTAQYKINQYKVDFLDWNGSLLKTEKVNYNSSATAPADPSRDWFTFTGWDRDYSVIATDLIVTAQYEEGQVLDYNITFTNSQDDSDISIVPIHIKVPAPPIIAGFTFVNWEIVASDIRDGFKVQAIYKADTPTSAPAVVTNPANPTQKLIRNGNVYILTGDRIYTITGQEVK